MRKRERERERERGKGGVVIKKRSLFLLGSSFVSQVNSTPFIIWLTAQRYFILSSWKDLFLKLHFITVQSAQCRQVNQVYFIKSNRLTFHNSIVSFQFSLMSNTTSFLSEFKFFFMSSDQANVVVCFLSIMKCNSIQPDVKFCLRII